MWDFFLGLAFLAFAWIFAASRREKERTTSSRTTLSSNVSPEGSSQSSVGSKETKHDPASLQVIEDLKLSLLENFQTIKLLEKKLEDKDATIRDYETGRSVQSRVIDELREEVAAFTETMELLHDKPNQIGFFAVSHPPRPVGVSFDEPSSRQLLFSEQEPAQKTISREQSLMELIIPEYRDEPHPEREVNTIKLESWPQENSHLVEQYKQKIDRQMQAVCELSETLSENLQIVKKLKTELEEKNESIRQLQEASENQAVLIEELKSTSAKYLKEIEQACTARESADLNDENHAKVVNELNMNLKGKEKTAEDLEKGRQEMEHMIETLRDSLSEESQKNQVLHHEIMKLSMSLEKLESASKKEQTEINDKQTEVEHAEIARLEGELEQKVNIIRILEEEKGKCLHHIAELKQHLEKTSSDLNEASFELREKSACITELEQTKEKLEKNHQYLITTSSQSFHDTEELTEKLQLQNAVVKDLQQTNTEQEIELKNLNEKLVSCLKEIEMYKEKEQDVNKRVKNVNSVKLEQEDLSDMLQRAINEQQLVIDELRPQLLKLQHKHEEEMAEKQDLIQKLRNELESALERCVNLVAEAKDNLQVIQELQLEREHQIRINKELKEELTQQARIVQGLQDDLACITQEAISSRVENISVYDFQKVMKKIRKSESDEKNYTLDDIEHEFNVKDEAIRKLTEENNASLSRIQELEDKVNSEENTTATQKLHSELEACKMTIDEQEDKLRSNGQVIGELREQVSAFQQLQDTIAVKEDTIQKLEAKLHLHLDKLKIEERKVKDFEKELLAQNFVTKEANAEKAKLAKAVEELQMAVRDGEDRMAGMMEQLDQARKENEELRASGGGSATAQAEEAENKLREQSARTEELVTECAMKADTVFHLERKLAALEYQLRDAECARNTVQLLEDQVARKSEKIQQLQKIEEIRAKSIVSLENENKLLSENICDLQKELTQLERRSTLMSTEKPSLQDQPTDGNGYLVSTAEEKVLPDFERTEGKITELNHCVNSHICVVHVDPHLSEAEGITRSVRSPTLTNGTQTKPPEGSNVPAANPIEKPPATDEGLLDSEFDKFSKYPIALLKKRSELLPADVHALRKEVHLSREQFFEMFGINWEEFAKLPAWKQQNLKKKVGLF